MMIWFFEKKGKKGTNLLQCHVAALSAKHTNHEFYCIICQAEEEKLKKLEKSAVQHEKLLATQAGLLWLTHYRSTLKCPSSITQWRLFSSSVVHVGNVVHKGSWKCGNVLVISNHMFIRKECYITDGILHFAQRVGTQTHRYRIQVCRRKYMNSSTGKIKNI